MIFLEFIGKTENGFLYHYKERKDSEEYGIIESDGENFNVIKALEEVSGSMKIHAIRKIREQIQKNIFESVTVAWY